MILGVDHVGIAVADVEGAAATFRRLLGHASTDVEHLAAQGVRVCFVPAGGWIGTRSAAAKHLPAQSGADTEPSREGFARPTAAPSARLELLEPLGGESSVGRFLTRRGEGMHHVCFAVDDITAELARLERDGFEPIDKAPRRGHGGLVAFLHPKSAHGVLIELLQRDPISLPTST
ncbi:MAG: VOC family protein [Chloroflexi bacterium]|nr:VOC family protein [Chloroflexota bacterium]